ncbi:MAG: hypothetical protein H7339_17140 [Arcicella sp.]|nr:hypothetical protein [Arcicella sp.]
MKFTKDDLVHKDDYSWHVDGGDNPDYRGIKDKVLVDKTEGYEVLYFCNHFLTDNDFALTVQNFRHVEHCLLLPELKAVKSRALLYENIKKNWFVYAFTQ